MNIIFGIKESLDHKQREHSKIYQELGGVLEKIRNSEEQLKSNEHVLEELSFKRLCV